MLSGFHLILSAYGFWLPNDPRGSWSDTVREYELRRFGPATKVTTRHSVAGRPHDHIRRLAAKRVLRYPPVSFDGEQARAIADGFRDAAEEARYHTRALAVLPDHAHLVIAWHERPAKIIATHLKARATAALNDRRINPMAKHTCASGRAPSVWARNYWCLHPQ